MIDRLIQWLGVMGLVLGLSAATVIGGLAEQAHAFETLSAASPASSTDHAGDQTSAPEKGLHCLAHCAAHGVAPIAPGDGASTIMVEPSVYPTAATNRMRAKSLAPPTRPPSV